MRYDIVPVFFGEPAANWHCIVVWAQLSGRVQTAVAHNTVPATAIPEEWRQYIIQ
jgi:hypothetical protein